MSNNKIEWSDDFDMDASTASIDEAKQGGASNDYIKLVEGDNFVRILPPRKGTNLNVVNGVEKSLPFVTVWHHGFNIPTTDGTKYITLNCSRLNNSSHCDVCARANTLTEQVAKQPANVKLAKFIKEIGPKKKYVWSAVAVDEPSASPKKLTLSKNPHLALLNCRGPRSGGAFFHPESGREIKINRTGTGQKTEYTIQACVDVTKLANMDWINEQIDLNSEKNHPDPEFVQDIVEQLDTFIDGLTVTAPSRPQRTLANMPVTRSGASTTAVARTVEPTTTPATKAAPMPSPRAPMPSPRRQ